MWFYCCSFASSTSVFESDCNRWCFFVTILPLPHVRLPGRATRVTKHFLIKLAEIIRRKVDKNPRRLRATIIGELKKQMEYYALLQKGNHFYEEEACPNGEDVDQMGLEGREDRTTAVLVVGLCLQWPNSADGSESMHKVSSYVLRVCKVIVERRKHPADLDRYRLAHHAVNHSHVRHFFGATAWQHRAFCCGTLATDCGMLDAERVSQFLQTF